MTMLFLTAACSVPASGLCVLAAHKEGLHLEPLRPHVAAIAAACAIAAFGMRGNSLEEGIVIAVCAAAAVTDLQTGYVFDVLVAPAAVALASIALVHHALPAYGLGTLISAGIPFALFVMTRGSGIGFGDVKLGCCIGALGAAAALRVVEAAFITGGCVAALLLSLRGRDARKIQMPFAPFLLTGVLIALLFPGGNG